MESHTPEQFPICGTFGRRKIRPCACIVDRKLHIRTFLRSTLEELEFITCECAEKDQLPQLLRSQRPDLVVLGVSSGGDEGAEILNTLAGQEFPGSVLLLGPRVSPMIAALRELGEQLKLDMLPVLTTPFAAGNLRDKVGTLLPTKVPQPPIELTEALANGWLELWYQPKVDVRTVTVAGAEALIRMRHPTWGIVTPSYFIPDDDDPQLQTLSEFTIAQSLRDWQAFLIESGPVEIAINLPMAFFQDQDSIKEFCLKLPNHPAFEGLIIEVNALEIIRNLDRAKAAARLLRFHNVGISIDDLGAEWPSLMRIEAFPFVEIKVDREFVTNCTDDHSKQALCRRIVGLAAEYGARTVAEGVETVADFLAVRAMGFDVAQGFLFSKAVPPTKFIRQALRETKFHLSRAWLVVLGVTQIFNQLETTMSYLVACT